MAASLSLLKPLPSHTLSPLPPTLPHRLRRPIACGPRDNRGPLVRGRTLSTEAILAIQALKRARSDPSKLAHLATTALSRLIKPDLLAALAELQRQGHCRLALLLFDAARREPWYTKTDYALYADMVAALARNNASAELDVLLAELTAEKPRPAAGDLRWIARLVKALLAAGRGGEVRDFYGVMRSAGCVPDEYVFRMMIRGLRRVGEVEAAGEVERDYQIWSDGGVIWTDPVPV